LELLLIPLFCALLVFSFRKRENAGMVALAGSIFTLLMTFYYAYDFPVDNKFHYGINISWINLAGIRFRLGMDGIGMLMLLLTNLLIPIIIGSGMNKEWERPGLYYGMVLFMQFALNGVFMALDGLMFYIFWELTLIPIYFICAIWGGENRIRITMKFFLYTFAGSLLMLLALILGYFNTQGMYSFSIEALYKIALTPTQAYWMMLAFFVAFAIKIPVFPFHTWQPDTYTAAPPQGTMLLSGIMLKMGLFGLLRWMLPIVPEALPQLQHLLITLAIVGVVYASVIAVRQNDMKRLLAYSSMGHVGLIAAGILTAGLAGIQGGLLQMLNHGINVVGLFFIADIIERRTGKRDLPSLGGIAGSAPKLATAFMIIMMGSVAVPLTNGFVGEFMLLKGLFDLHWAYAAAGGLSVIFTAVYMLRAYQFSMFGEQGKAVEGFTDLDKRELFILGVICILVLLLGVYPQPILNLTAPAVHHLLEVISQAKSITP